MSAQYLFFFMDAHEFSVLLRSAGTKCPWILFCFQLCCICCYCLVVLFCDCYAVRPYKSNRYDSICGFVSVFWIGCSSLCLQRFLTSCNRLSLLDWGPCFFLPPFFSSDCKIFVTGSERLMLIWQVTGSFLRFKKIPVVHHSTKYFLLSPRLVQFLFKACQFRTGRLLENCLFKWLYLSITPALTLLRPPSNAWIYAAFECKSSHKHFMASAKAKSNSRSLDKPKSSNHQ